MPEIKTKVASIVVEGAEVRFEYSVDETGEKRCVYWRAILDLRESGQYGETVISAAGRTPKTAFKACMGRLYDFMLKI